MPPGPCAPTAAEGRAQRSGAGPKGQSCRHASAPASRCRKPGRGGGWRNSCPRLSRHPHALGAAKGPAEEGPKPAKSSPNCCPAACQAPEHPACPPPQPGSSDRWGPQTWPLGTAGGTATGCFRRRFWGKRGENAEGGDQGRHRAVSLGTWGLSVGFRRGFSALRQG